MKKLLAIVLLGLLCFNTTFAADKVKIFKSESIGFPNKVFASFSLNPAICTASSQADAVSARLICFLITSGIFEGRPNFIREKTQRINTLIRKQLFRI